MLQATLALGIAGLVFGALLALAAQKFKVEVDPKVEEILSVLPGANCGGCGYPGCSGLASAIAAGKAPVNACVVGGNPVAEKVAEIMGQSAESVEPMMAVVYCQGAEGVAKKSAKYEGVEDCRSLDQLGGTKICPFGCLGLGTCVKACPFDAMYMSEKGLPVVIKEKCTGCGACVRACPRNVIGLVPKSKEVHVLCRSYDKGAVAIKYCRVSCVACQICVKSCPQNAISMDRGTLAKIDYSLCDNCGICASKCPARTIFDMRKDKVRAAS